MRGEKPAVNVRFKELKDFDNIKKVLRSWQTLSGTLFAVRAFKIVLVDPAYVKVL